MNGTKRSLVAAKRPSSASGPPAGAGPLSRGKKLAFSAVSLVLLLAGLELLLAIIGVKPERFEKDPFIGFASQNPLFVEQRSPEGQVLMVTAPNKLPFFNPQRFPREKEAGVFRIFCLGGSTAYGHPFTDSTSFNGWLRELLAATAPQRRWEVINAGGISYGTYRDARLMEELIGYEPDLFVLYGSHNEFLERRIYGKVVRAPPVVRGLAGAASRLRSASLVKRGLEAVLTRPEPGVGTNTLLHSEPVTLLESAAGPASYKRDEPLRRQILQHYEFNLGRMVDIARSAGARVIFIVPASNLREATPFKSEHSRTLAPEERRRWEALYDQARRDFESPTPTNGLIALAQAESLDSGAANLHFVRGRLLEKLGRYPEALAAYERARDEDVCPLRATGPLLQILKRVSAEHEIPLIDYPAVIAAQCDHGIPGAQMFLDHVHPTVEGYRLLALEILKVMERESMAQPNLDPAVLERLNRDVTEHIDTKAQALALMNLCKTLGWARKREEAYRAGVRAVALCPDLPEIRYETGLAAMQVGKPREAEPHFERALRLQPNHAEAHCCMGVILGDRGEYEKAAEHFRRALASGQPANRSRYEANLTAVLNKLGSAPERAP